MTTTPSLRERRQQQLRDEILDATRALLTQKGYSALSMDDLAAHIGISKPTLYSYFANKDTLIGAAVEREMDRIVAMVEEPKSNQTPIQRLTAILAAIIHTQADEGTMTLRPVMPDLHHIICSHAGILQRIRRLQLATDALVQEGMACGEIDPSLDPATVVHALYGLANTLKFAHFANMEPLDPVKVADTLTRLFVRGVRA